MSRAKPMTPDERREAIVAATLPLLLEQGPEISTSQIAEAARVAEGTIFRVFETKADLIHATIHAALEPTAALAQIGTLDPSDTLEQRVVAVFTILSEQLTRTRALFVHLAGVGLGRPRPHPQLGPAPGQTDGRLRMLEATTTALAPYADQLRVPVVTAAKLLNALAFAAGFGTSADDPPPTAESLATTVLYGIAQGEK
jgi:AcrR family transcriptional regulator